MTATSAKEAQQPNQQQQQQQQQQLQQKLQEIEQQLQQQRAEAARLHEEARCLRKEHGNGSAAVAAAAAAVAAARARVQQLEEQQQQLQQQQGLDADTPHFIKYKQQFENLIKRKFFVVPAFEIYGGSGGLFDLGPPGKP